MIEGGLGSAPGQAPFIQQGGTEFVVIHLEALLFELGDLIVVIAALDEDSRVFVGEERRQRELANPGEQADREQFLAGDLREMSEFLTSNAGCQRVPPEAFIVNSLHVP